MAGTADSGPNAGFIARAHKLLIVFGGCYVVFLILACVPSLQRGLIYCNWLSIPLSPDYTNPEAYGLAPHKTLNLRISTPDGESLGAWFVLSDNTYRSQSSPTPSPITNDTLASALRSRSTILYLHGNAGTRAARTRVEHLRSFSGRLDVNVLALDYRGFGDSSGTPSEAGLTTDAVSAFEWLVAHGADEGGILIAGTSLGTGVSVQAAHELEKRGRKARGVVLFAPFSDIASLLDTYYILGLVPLMKPLSVFPPLVANTFKSFLTHKFDSLAKVKDLHQPLLLVHAEDDWDIPFSHSARLFASALADRNKDETDVTRPDPDAVARVEERVISRLGTMQVLSRGVGRGAMAHLLSQFGAHERVGLQEGVQDVMRDMFNL